MEHYLEIIAGLALLFLGGEILVRGASDIAKKIGMSPFLVGLTIVAYGTSSPELFISIQAALKGHSGIALGNVIGSNISNILCVLGITAVVCPIPINKKEVLQNSYMSFAITVVMCLFCLTGNIGFLPGFLCVFVLTVNTAKVFHLSRRKRLLEEVEEKVGEVKSFKDNILVSLVFILFGLGALVEGSDLLVKGSVYIAHSLGLSEDIIGVTIVAFGGSTPELATSIISAFRKKPGIAIGSILGSNIFNILGVLGVSGMLANIEVSENFLIFDIPILILSTTLFLFVVSKCKQFSRIMGCFLFSSYILYIFTKIYM